MPLTNPSPNSSDATGIKSTKVTPFSIGASKISVSLLTANPNRKGASIWNESDFNLYIECGKVASASAFCAKITPGSYYELPYGYTGILSGIWVAEEGQEPRGLALVREFI